MSTTAKDIEGLSYLELKALLEKKKETEISEVKKKLTAAEGIVAELQAQLANLGETAAPSGKRRGRKPGSKNKSKGPIAKKAMADKKAKRGAVGAAIRAFVASKGKAGAKVAEIAAHLGSKPANVTAFFYAKGNKKEFKKVAPATFAAVK